MKWRAGYRLSVYHLAKSWQNALKTTVGGSRLETLQSACSTFTFHSNARQDST